LTRNKYYLLDNGFLKWIFILEIQL
jgi:hypothetical protein